MRLSCRRGVDRAVTERRFVLGIGLAAAIALAVRVTYVLTVGRRVPLMGDAATYRLLALHLADGAGYVRPYELIRGDEVPTAEFPPLFPALLSLAVRAGITGTTALKLVMTPFGAATAAIIGVLGRVLGGPAVGVIAALIAAVYPMLFQPDAALMPETLAALFVAAAVLLALLATQRHSPALWVATGATLGLGALVRAEIAALAPLLAIPLILRVRRERRDLVHAAALFAAVAAVVLPWTVRNAIRLDHFVPVSNNVGGLILGSNCPPAYDGRSRGLWFFDCYDRVEANDLDETERSRAFLREGLAYAGARPGQAAEVAGIRLLRVWGVWDPDGQIAWETFEGRDRTWQTVGHRMYVALAGLGVLGAVASFRRRTHLWPLLAPFVLVAVTAVVSYGNQRFRVTAEPSIVVLAAAGAVELARAAKRRFSLEGATA